MIAGIYCIKCEVNGKIYVGESINIFERWKNHLLNLKSGRHVCEELQEDYDKYGCENFSFTILELVKWDDKDKDNPDLKQILLYKESVHGQRLNADKSGIGYNYISGFSYETRDYKNVIICPEIEKIIRANRKKDAENYINLYKMFITSYQEDIQQVYITSFTKFSRVLNLKPATVKTMTKNLIKYKVIKPEMYEYVNHEAYPNGCRTTYYYLTKAERQFQKKNPKTP